MDNEIGQFRLFTAIALPNKIKEKVSEITRGRLPVSYVNTDNLHITLNFFGDLETAREETVKSIFKDVCSGRKAFTIEFESIVAHHNRQIHLTLRPNPQLVSLQKDLEREFEQHSFRFTDRDFYPHVTLANMNMDNVLNRKKKIENFPNDELEQLKFNAQEIVLYASKLLLHHPQHTPLMKIDLI